MFVFIDIEQGTALISNKNNVNYLIQMCGSAREDEEAWRGCGAVRKVFSVIIISHFRSNYNFYFSAIIQ